MSLIRVAAPLIRLAAVDENYGRDLHDAVTADEDTFVGLVRAQIQPVELGWLKPTEWLWFARWRQATGAGLDEVVLPHLARSALTRSARFEVRSLVLRDPSTNRVAPEYPNTLWRTEIGLRWLNDQARDPHVDPRELALDSLQCATEASWFALRRLTSGDDERGLLVREQLNGFADLRGISPEVTSRWRYQR